MDPYVSIVVVTYNRMEDTRRVMARLRKHADPRVEVIVIDNASTDGCAEMIEKEFPDMKLVRCKKNYGIPSYNRGFDVARGEIIVVINNDSYPAADTIGRIIDFFGKNKNVGILQGRIMNIISRDLFYPPRQELRTRKLLCDFVVAGAAIRKEVLSTVGHFPASTFLFGAEHDLCLRALSAGYEIEYCDDILFYHLHRPEYMPSLFNPFFYHVRSYYWIIWRRYPFLKALDSTIWLTFVLLKRAFRERKLKILFYATMDAFRKLPLILGERKPVEMEFIKRSEDFFPSLSNLSVLGKLKQRLAALRKPLL